MLPALLLRPDLLCPDLSCPDAGVGPQASVVSPSRFLLHDAASIDRAAVEQFVQRIYHGSYGAQLHAFLPLLLELRNIDHTQAVLGMRPGAMGTPMFLEHYLDQPVEQVVAGRAGAPVARTDIVEIGNLAATRRGASPLLFLMMAAALEAAGFRWLAFTATPQVEKLVSRLQYRPLVLGAVDPSRLGAQVSNWGTYYETRPQVMCVALAPALRAGRTSPAIDATLDTSATAIATLAHSLREHRLRHALESTR